MAQDSEEELIFEKSGVFIHTTVVVQPDEDALVAGKILLIAKKDGTYVEWRPIPERPPSSETNRGDTEWTVVEAVGYKAGKTSSDAAVSVKTKPAPTPTRHKYVINFDVGDLKSFRRSMPNLGWSYIIFILRCGTTFPALHFHHGGTKAFIKQLEKHLVVKKSSQDSCLFLVRDHDPQALSKSFDELNLFEEQTEDIITKFIKDPYTATLGGFSKVTNFLRDALLVADDTRPLDDAADILLEDVPGMAINNRAEPGFEMITTRELPARVAVERCQPLNPQDWSRYMDHAGLIMDVDLLKDTIFRGGVDPSMRIETWKFLLNYYNWSSTYQTRTEQRKQKVDDYFRMKLQWKSLSEDQERHFSMLRDRRSLIDKDVTRTDRTHHFFAGEGNPNLAVLFDILMTYCMYNFDLGYVQGMSDLLAPILVVMENEVDAFWCFAGFMDLVYHNFDMDQEGMKKQLVQLHTLVRFTDPQLCNYLERHESGNMYFCFRWLLIVFKREFSFPDIMRLWEVVWTGKPCANFHLLICLAILDTEKTTLMENNFGFTEILKHINDISGQIELEPILCKAEAIYVQLSRYDGLPPDVASVVGLPDSRAAGDGHQGQTADGGDATPNGTAPTDDGSIEILPVDDTDLVL